MLPKRRDSRGDFSDLLNGRPTFGHCIEPHTTGSTLMKILQLLVSDTGIKHNHCAAIGAKPGNSVKSASVVVAIDAGLDDHAALDAQRIEHFLILHYRRFRRRIASL